MVEAAVQDRRQAVVLVETEEKVIPKNRTAAHLYQEVFAAAPSDSAQASLGTRRSD